MMVLELTFTDDPRRLDARPAHRERLRALHGDGRLVLAGPYADDDGALLVLDVEPGDVEQIVADDPYYTTPGVQVTSIREWRPVVGLEKAESAG